MNFKLLWPRKFSIRILNLRGDIGRQGGLSQMRRFHSYGPVDCEEHFCVPRRELVQECLDQLIGHPDKGGHYFTIWAPRQTGKTWLIRQVQDKIATDYEAKFLVGAMPCRE